MEGHSSDAKKIMCEKNLKEELMELNDKFWRKKNQGLKMHLAIIVQVAIGHTAAKLEFLNQDDFFFCKKKKKKPNPYEN